MESRVDSSIARLVTEAWVVKTFLHIDLDLVIEGGFFDKMYTPVIDSQNSLLGLSFTFFVVGNRLHCIPVFTAC
jgi:hypothetical protein